jgi:2-oxoglutarate ferredoxin oxidoreductase subunit alpha
MRVNPGTPGGLFKAPGNEHDDFGFVATDSKTRIKNQERRFRKENYIKDELPLPKLYGNENAEITFVCWGSTKLPLMEALKFTEKFNFIHFSAVNPINWEDVKNIFKGKKLVAIETNFTGQLASIIAEKTGIVIEDKFLKYDGRPFFVEEILDFVERGR